MSLRNSYVFEWIIDRLKRSPKLEAENDNN